MNGVVDALHRLIILIDCGITPKEVPLTPGSEAVSIVAHESVDRGSNVISVHPITAGSAKLPDWLIRKAEETFENNIKGPQKKSIRYGDPMQSVNNQISFYPQHENWKIEKRLKKEISVEKLKRTKDDTNKMNMSKRHNQYQGNPIFPRGAQLPLL